MLPASILASLAFRLQPWTSFRKWMGAGVTYATPVPGQKLFSDSSVLSSRATEARGAERAALSGGSHLARDILERGLRWASEKKTNVCHVQLPICWLFLCTSP